MTTAKAYLELLQRGDRRRFRATEGGGGYQGGGGGQGAGRSKGGRQGTRAVLPPRGRGGESGGRISVTDSFYYAYNPEKYKSPKPLIQIGALVPGIPLKCIFELECLEDIPGPRGQIQVLPSQLERRVAGDGSIGIRRQLLPWS